MKKKKYIEKYKELKEQQILLIQDNNELRLKLKQVENEKITLMDECKETKLELIEVKKELKILKRKNIDPTRFMEWTSDEFVDWICILDEGKYSKYEEQLRRAFISESISGEAIPHINKNEWKELFGINNYMDRTNLDKHVKNLIKRNKDNSNDNDNGNAETGNYNEGGNMTEYH